MKLWSTLAGMVFVCLVGVMGAARGATMPISARSRSVSPAGVTLDSALKTRSPSFIGQGTSIGYGEPGAGDPAELYARAPDQLATIVRQREGNLTRVFDGRNG